VHFGAKIKDSVGNAPSLSYHIQEFTMVVLRLRLSFAVDMPYLNPHWWQQEMLDASCSLNTFCFGRTNDSKTDTSILSPL
jgi:hypothetical protein